MVLGKLPVPGILLIWIRVGQGPTALAVGAGRGCLDIFTAPAVGAGRGCLDIFFCRLSFLFFLPLARRWSDIY